MYTDNDINDVMKQEQDLRDAAQLVASTLGITDHNNIGVRSISLSFSSDGSVNAAVNIRVTKRFSSAWKARQAD